MSDPAPNAEPDAAARFEAAALPFLDALYRKALVLTDNPADAEDLVQETMLRAYRTFANFVAGTNCRAWLFTILYSIFVNQYRRRRREPDTVPLEELEAGYHHLLADAAAGREVAALLGPAANWQGPEVGRALASLPAEFRAAVLLVDVEELSYDEAARVLDCPTGTLRSRLFRGRRLLFLELRDYAKRMGIIRGFGT